MLGSSIRNLVTSRPFQIQAGRDYTYNSEQPNRVYNNSERKQVGTILHGCCQNHQCANNSCQWGRPRFSRPCYGVGF